MTPNGFDVGPPEPGSASLYLTLAGLYLPMPDADGGIQVEATPLATKKRMYSGLLRVDYTATKHKITLRWSLLTAAEWQTLLGIYDGYIVSASTLVLPDGSSYTVLIADNALAHTRWYDPQGAAFYTTSLVLEEV